MAIRIALECGHTSMLRMRTTPEGYTHDWEVFVRGIDNADIHHYVEKVVFQLHETFPKPKRILKDPPFVIKQSGYAGFEIPIHIYLKNKDDGTKKIEILYDLNLQSSGPAITNVIKHIETINNPSDEFRRKLLKGGGVLVSTSEHSSEKIETKTPTMVSKPKLSGSDSRRHKNVESKTSNSFAELFGTPLKPTKVSQDTKKPTQPEKSSASKSSITTEKSDKVDKAKLKDSPHKDGKKEKIDDKKDKKVKDQSRDRNRSKEKSKKPPSPGNRSHSSPPNKTPPAVPVKKPPSPLPPAKRPASPKPKDKELKKVPVEKEKEKTKEKAKDSSKNIADSSKSDKRKDKKKHKEDRDKERKDKYKDGEQSSSKEAVKVTEKKNDKPEKSDRTEKEKSQEYKSTKDGRKSPKLLKESDKPKDEKLLKNEKSEKTEKTDKTKDGKSEKDRQKHKHKKRDKKDKRDSSKDRDRKEKRERIKSSGDKQNNVPNASAATPLSTLLAEITERDSSDSPPSVDEDSYSESKLVSTAKKEAENLTVSTPPTEMAKPPSPAMPMMDIKKDKIERIKRERSKGSKGEDTRKRKRKSDSKLDDEPTIKREKDRGQSTSPSLEPVSSSQSPVVVDQEMAHVKEERSVKEGQALEKNIEVEAEQVAPDSTNSTLVDSDVGEPPVFSEDYVSQLKDLQQKIMTLQDNDELQRVVQVIAETGQYEITKKTFDFDLCALDRRTVQRLQQFFAS